MMNQRNIDYFDNLILLYSRDKISGEQVDELLKWVDADPKNREYFKDQLAIYRGITAAAQDMDIEELKKARFPVKRRYIGWIGAAAVAAAFILFWYVPGSADATETLYGKGLITEYKLDDGSRVWLSGKSSLKKQKKFTADERSVSLNGEAYFVVAKDKKRPFLVNIGNVQVKVVGTRFVVDQNKQQNLVNISVLEGKVDVLYNGRGPVRLIKNDEIDVTLLGYTIKSYNEESQNITMQKGVIVFSEAKLSDVAKMLNRIYGVPFIIADKELGNLRLTSKIKRQTLGEVKFILERSLDVTVTINDGVVVITK